MKKVTIWLIVPVLFAGCHPPQTPNDLIVRYQMLSNRHQVHQLLALYTEDARLDFGPLGIITGLDQIRDIHNYDRALHTEMDIRISQTEDHRVTCRMVERNDWLRAADIHRILYTRVVFTLNRQNRISAITATPAPASADSMRRALQDFDSWARANAPDAYAHLFRDDGSFHYGFESGKQVLALLHQWKSATGTGG